MTLPLGCHEPLDEARRIATEHDTAVALAAESKPLTPLQAFMRVFPEFQAPSWDGWRVELGRLTDAVREWFAICGRGSGKSRIVGLIATFFATRDYRRALGENVYVGVFAPDRRQAGLTFRYIVGLIKSVPALAALIVNETRDSVELANGVIVEVVTASVAAPRGRAYACAIVEEAAFLPTDDSANPDVELLRALRPALARVPGSLLCVVSSPYARKGVLWTAVRKYAGQPDGDVVVTQKATLALNPTFDARSIARAFEEDPVSAAAEYDAQFRTDVEGFVSREAVDAVTIAGRLELPPGHNEIGVVDVAGGGGTDSFAWATARNDSDVGVLTSAREIRPPFSPEQAVAECAQALAGRGITSVIGDKYAGEWPREQFLKHGISYEPSAKPKSDLYRELLPALNSQRVELLDLPRLASQLVGLERRVARGGRDTIDHAPGAHDDVANAAALALTVALGLGPLVAGAGLLAFAVQEVASASRRDDVVAAAAVSEELTDDLVTNPWLVDDPGTYQHDICERTGNYHVVDGRCSRCGEFMSFTSFGQ